MKHLKKFKLFESLDYDDNLEARSDEWCLYSFDDLSEFIKFEESVSPPDDLLTKGPFSYATSRHRDGGEIGNYERMFNQYKDNYGKLYLLINVEDISNLYMFNCSESKFFGVFDSNIKKHDFSKIDEILQDLDYISPEVEQLMFSTCVLASHTTPNSSAPRTFMND